MATGHEQELHVLIVGAGTSGLLVAQGLKKANIPFTIFEYETATTYQSRPREWGMTLHWGSSHIASCLPPELAARIHEAYADPSLSPDSVTGIPMHNGKTGEIVTIVKGDKPMRVSRRKMRKLFSEDIDVQYGKEVLRAFVNDDGKAQVEFKDGTSAVGDILVGCDGARSRVRESICGAEAAKLTDVPCRMFNFTYQFDAELAVKLRDVDPIFITSTHPDHGTLFLITVCDVPDPSDPSTWTFQLIHSWLDDTTPADAELSTFEGRMALFKSRSEQFVEPWCSVGRAVSSSTEIPLDRMTYWERAAAWDNRSGRMTLCGDAAHPMTPSRGQGLNNALMDASRFVAAMISVRDGKALEDAVEEYDREVLERGMAEMELSVKSTMMIHNWETLMQSPMMKMGMYQEKKE